MRATVACALAAAALALAGCVAEPDPEGTPAPDPSAPAPRDILYACPGEALRPDPCGGQVSAAAFEVSGLDYRAEPALVLVGLTSTPPAAGDGEEPLLSRERAQVAWSRDDGASWSSSPLPPVVTATSGQPGAVHGLSDLDVAIAADGSWHASAAVDHQPHKQVIGGNAVPAEVQSESDIVHFVSHDEGASWTPTTLTTGEVGRFPMLHVTGEGVVLLLWQEVLGDARVLAMSWSGDGGVSWQHRRDPTLDCRLASAVDGLGAVVIACVEDVYAFDAAGAPVLLRFDPATGEVVQLVPDPATPLPTECGLARVVTLPDAIGLLLGACPDLVLMRSLDGRSWTSVLHADPARLQAPEWDDAGVELLAADAAASDMHAIVGVSRIDADGTVQSQRMHVVLDAVTGATRHQAPLGGGQVDQVAIVHGTTPFFTVADLALGPDDGWMAWGETTAMLGRLGYAPG